MLFFKKKSKVISAPDNLLEAYISLRFLLKGQINSFEGTLVWTLDKMYSADLHLLEVMAIPTKQTWNAPTANKAWYLYKACEFMIEVYGVPLPGNNYKQLINISNMFQFPQYQVDEYVTRIGKELKMQKPQMQKLQSISNQLIFSTK